MKKNILVIVIVVLIIVAGGAYYWFSQSKLSSNGQPVAGTTSQNSAATAAEVKAILAKLQVHMVLPTGEDPQIGRIDDPIQAAKAQPFVAGAQKGDLLIVYIKARKAIVYSPARDLIVNVGPVSVNPDQTAAATPTPTTPTKTPTKK